MQKNWQFLAKPWILSTNDPVVLAIFLLKKSGLAFFSPKNESISGKTLDFVYQRPGGFGKFFAKKEWIGIFCQKTKIGMSSKLAETQHCEFGQLVLICWPWKKLPLILEVRFNAEVGKLSLRSSHLCSMLHWYRQFSHILQIIVARAHGRNAR